MSCFIIPDSIIGEIEATCSRFWWGSTLDHKRNSSYIWKSLLWGKNLVAKGVRWCVGDGKKISIYKSHWIPIPRNFMVSSPKRLPPNSILADLLDERGKWNAQLIRDSFLDFEVEKIIQI
ncbi:hypothetical protein UlMin_030662 [Ulmus minor]